MTFYALVILENLDWKKESLVAPSQKISPYIFVVNLLFLFRRVQAFWRGGLCSPLPARHPRSKRWAHGLSARSGFSCYSPVFQRIWVFSCKFWQSACDTSNIKKNHWHFKKKPTTLMRLLPRGNNEGNTFFSAYTLPQGMWLPKCLQCFTAPKTLLDHLPTFWPAGWPRKAAEKQQPLQGGSSKHSLQSSTAWEGAAGWAQRGSATACPGMSNPTGVGHRGHEKKGQGRKSTPRERAFFFYCS